MKKTKDMMSNSSHPVQVSSEYFTRKEITNGKKKGAVIQQKPTLKDSTKMEEKKIPIHFHWALMTSVCCFFTIGPCWALYKIGEVRRLIKTNQTDDASRLSNKISTILLISSMFGGFIWVSLLFCTVGLLLTGKLLILNYI